MYFSVTVPQIRGVFTALEIKDVFDTVLNLQ